MGNNVSIVKQSRRLGLALTSKAVRFMERRPYLTRSRDDMLVKLDRLPTRAEVPVSCAVSLVIEYYKR